MSNNAGLGPKLSEAPTIKKRKVPRRQPNTAYRSREYLTDTEVTALMKTAAHVGRHGVRDAALILIAYRHGLRVSELASLRWDQVDLQQGLLHVVRRKNGIASVHPLRGPELRALRRLQRDYPHMAYVFLSERKAPLTVDICCATAQDTNWPTTARIRGRSNNTWDTATSRTQLAIPSWHLTDSKISGVIDPLVHRY
jgi:type 1 fimbriae regulatory protein FimB/type 1 fimbriae regulatory protein FimE